MFRRPGIRWRFATTVLSYAILVVTAIVLFVSLSFGGSMPHRSAPVPVGFAPVVDTRVPHLKPVTVVLKRKPPVTTTTTVPKRRVASPPVLVAAPRPRPVVKVPKPLVTIRRPVVPAPAINYCAEALAYLAAHAKPGYSLFCDTSALASWQAAETCSGPPACVGPQIVISKPWCARSYENEASNSWYEFPKVGRTILAGERDASGRAWDPYGQC